MFKVPRLAKFIEECSACLLEGRMLGNSVPNNPHLLIP